MKTMNQLFLDMLAKTESKSFQENRWGARHCRAWREPGAEEAGIVGLLKSAANYADHHRSEYLSDIGEDGVLGPAWEKIMESVRVLLNGNCGRLDCGTLDGLITDMMRLAKCEVDA